MRKKNHSKLKRQIAKWAISQMKKHRVGSFALGRVNSLVNSKIKNKQLKGLANLGLQSAKYEVGKRGFGVGLSGAGTTLAGGCCRGRGIRLSGAGTTLSGGRRRRRTYRRRRR